MPSGTLIKPPPKDPSKSPIENVLELTTLTDIGPDIFTNTRPLWHPPGARGIYGGAVIAQCLAAAQHTIPPPSPANNNATFFIHSMHCYFVLAGDASIPILYHVERVREGKSFMTRTVQARQRGKCIFTTTASFVREDSAGKKTVDHEYSMPEGVREELENNPFETDNEQVKIEKAANGEDSSGPFITKRLTIWNNSSPHPHTKRTRQWVKARGQITPSSGPQDHLSALAYMSDSYFIGAVARVQNLWRFGDPLPTKLPNKTLHPMAAVEAEDNVSRQDRPKVGMMVSLDHTIFFHRPRDTKADEWMFSEMESSWAGDGRGLVFQKIWNREGQLIATCVQEGLVRLQQDNEDKAKAKSKL